MAIIRTPHLHKRIDCCAICGSDSFSNRIERHHLGGVANAPFFTIPLCVDHHLRVTALINQASRQEGVDLMQESSDPGERARRARLAAMIFLWFVDEIVSHPAVVENAKREAKLSRQIVKQQRRR
jgi:hypothetical protein